MVHGLDIRAVGIEHERRVVAGVVLALAGAAVVAPAGRQRGCMEAVDGRPVLRLERDVQPSGGRPIVAHEELVGREPAVSRADLQSDRLERPRVEALARLEVTDAEMQVVEEPAGVSLGHAGQTTALCPFGSSSSRTGARSQCASSARVATSGSKPWRSLPPTTSAPCTHGRPTRRSEITGYLHSEEHIRAARVAEADAIHPGYGFLAENGDFAEAVEAAGLTWVGPPPEALRLGGDKLEAKRIAREAGVPVLPDGPPDEIGFPLLVKAAAGGGGRGMRVVRSPGELEDALAAAEREASGAFGDGTLYCERYLERPRHVEVQLLADAHGNVVALGERDCSVQRRHQKVLEEAPAPGLSPSLRASLHDAAVAFGRAIGYRSAGTVEFVVDGDAFYFLELNGRIQVEHPVTEAVTGLDLVERQIRVAEGEAIASSESPAGHAVEVRLYAEDSKTFLPQAGRIERLRLPTAMQGIRIDSGVEEGDEIGLAYDPLIAKLIAHGHTRADALDRLSEALGRHRRPRRYDEPRVPPLARGASDRPRWRRHDCIPHREPAVVGAPPPPGSRRVPAAVAAQPSRAVSRAASRHRRRVPSLRRNAR